MTIAFEGVVVVVVVAVKVQTQRMTGIEGFWIRRPLPTVVVAGVFDTLGPVATHVAVYEKNRNIEK